MPPEERDQAFLWDKREAARAAREVADEVGTFERLLASRVHQLALAKAIELIGEAARRVSGTFVSAHPERPWPQIINMRHRIVHDYRGINFEILWNVAEREINPLLEWLDEQLPENEEGSGSHPKLV